jgi:surface protein
MAEKLYRGLTYKERDGIKYYSYDKYAPGYPPSSTPSATPTPTPSQTPGFVPSPTPTPTPSATPGLGYISFSIDTTLSGGTGTDQFKWDFAPPSIMPMTVYWGDGNSDYLTVSTVLTHTYSSPGKYRITVDCQNPGNFDWQQSFAANDSSKVISIDSWGNNYKRYTFPNLRDNSFGSFNNITGFTTTTAPLFLSGTCSQTYSLSSFRDMVSFQSGVGHWDVSYMCELNEVFDNCQSFNEDLSGWDTSRCQEMNALFYDARSFDQDLGSWNISQLTLAVNMFFGSGLSTANYDKILVGWASQAPNIQRNVNFTGTPCGYTAGSAAETARSFLINSYGWNISDGGPV